MTTPLSVFQFRSTAVRTVVISGEAWFVASDVAKALNYRNANDMTRMLDDDERGTHNVRTPSGDQEMIVINESGLYHAVLKSRKPEARAFRQWVTSEVLPTIRKTGAYGSGPITDGMLVAAATKKLQATRFIAQFCDSDYHGGPAVPFLLPISPDACVMTPADMLRALADPNGLKVSDDQLAEFIIAATRRLQQRCKSARGTAPVRKGAA